MYDTSILFTLISVWTKLLNSVIFTAGRLLAAVEILVSAYGVNDCSSTSHLSAPNTEKTERMKEKERGGEPTIGFGPMAYYTDWLLSFKLILHLILDKETTLLL